MSKIVFIASGGTGGHIIPARCLAKELASTNKVIVLGDDKVVAYAKESDEFISRKISSSQLKKEPAAIVKAIFRIGIGILESIYVFLKYQPKVVVAFGGFATFPILIAAVLTRTEIILHEQNSHLGKVNRIFARFAKNIALSFKNTSGIREQYLKKTIFTGNPVRDEILELHDSSYVVPQHKKDGIRKDNKMGYNILLASDFNYEEKERELFNILVIGGSGGARIFSEILPKAFFNLSEEIKSYITVTQQCRSELMKSTFDSYKSFNINIVVNSFFEDMPALIARSHLVIARSGSSSIFEFCAAKKPMILIPFALSADNHQDKNARYLEKNGAAIVIEEKDFTINAMAEILVKLIGNESILKKMSQNAGELAVLEATKNLAKIIK